MQEQLLLPLVILAFGGALADEFVLQERAARIAVEANGGE